MQFVFSLLLLLPRSQRKVIILTYRNWPIAHNGEANENFEQRFPMILFLINAVDRHNLERPAIALFLNL